MSGEGDTAVTTRWVLTAEFNSIAEDQANTFSERYPLGDAAEFYRQILKLWAVDAEDVADDITWSGETVTVQSDMIDCVYGPVKWLLMHTVPKKVTLERHD